MDIEHIIFLWLCLWIQWATVLNRVRAPVRGPSLRAFRARLPRGFRVGPWLLPAVRRHGALPPRTPLSATLARPGASTRAGPLSVGQVLLHALRFSPYPKRWRCAIMKAGIALTECTPKWQSLEY